MPNIAHDAPVVIAASFTLIAILQPIRPRLTGYLAAEAHPCDVVDTIPTVHQKPFPMEETMTYVVEIEDKHGRRAVKEYDASSPYDLLGRVRFELTAYPEFRPVAAWHKEQPEKAVYL